MKQLLLIIGLLGCLACEQQHPASSKKNEVPEKRTVERKEKKTLSTPETKKQQAASVFHAQYYFSDSLGWGYDILKGKSVLIHQPHIPAIQGNHGFKSEYDAQKAANRVMDKLDHNIMPPTLSVDELRELGVL